MLEMVADGGLWSLVSIVLCVIGYSRFAHKLSTVAVPASEDLAGTELEGGEKMPLLQASASELEGRRDHADALCRPLVRWAAGVLPINAAVCYLVCVHGVAASEGTLALWHDILLSYFAIGPVLGALSFLFYTYVLTHNNLRPSAETYCTLRRTCMLDGVVFPPGLVLGAVCTFPAMFAQEGWAVWLGTAVYAAQADVWARFFCASQCESAERAGGRFVV